MRTCTLLATGQIIEAQSGDSPDFAALIRNAEAAGHAADAVVCEVRPDAVVEAVFRLQALVPAEQPTRTVTRAAFRLRLAPAYLALPGLDDRTQAKWDRILRDFLGDYDAVNLDDTTLQSLVGLAVGDGLLTQEQAAAALA